MTLAAHFQLRRQPFALRRPVKALRKSGGMTEGLAPLHYLTQHRRLGLVRGASGLGKPTAEHFPRALTNWEQFLQDKKSDTSLQNTIDQFCRRLREMAQLLPQPESAPSG